MEARDKAPAPSPQPEPLDAAAPKVHLVVSAAETKDSDRPSPVMATARLALDYLKALTWPVLILGLLVAYRPPLGRIIESLATKLEQADSVTIGSLSLEVQERARDLGSPELGREIGQLSFNAIEALMRTPASGSMILLSTNDRTTPPEYGLPPEAVLAGLAELEEKKLITFEEPLAPFLKEFKSVARPRPSDSRVRSEDRQWYTVSNSNGATATKLRSQGYRLTGDGKKAVEAITKAVASQLTKPG